MSIASIVTRGFGSFGSPSDIVTLGFSIGEAKPEVFHGAAYLRRKREKKRRDEQIDQPQISARITEQAPAGPEPKPAEAPGSAEVPEVLAKALARRNARQATQPPQPASPVAAVEPAIAEALALANAERAAAEAARAELLRQQHDEEELLLMLLI